MPIYSRTAYTDWQVHRTEGHCQEFFTTTSVLRLNQPWLCNRGVTMEVIILCNKFGDSKFGDLMLDCQIAKFVSCQYVQPYGIYSSMFHRSVFYVQSSFSACSAQESNYCKFYPLFHQYNLVTFSSFFFNGFIQLHITKLFLLKVCRCNSSMIHIACITNRE